MASLCHPWFTTTNLSYRFPIFATSATALCGTTGNNIWMLNHGFGDVLGFFTSFLDKPNWSGEWKRTKWSVWWRANSETIQVLRNPLHLDVSRWKTYNSLGFELFSYPRRTRFCGGLGTLGFPSPWGYHPTHRYGIGQSIYDYCAGWWCGTFFFHILGIIIPTD